jgi:hypothetical protein
MSQKSGREEARSLESDSTLTSLPLKMKALVDPNFGPELLTTIQIIVGVYS